MDGICYGLPLPCGAADGTSASACMGFHDRYPTVSVCMHAVCMAMQPPPLAARPRAANWKLYKTLS
jgi:hypothetical protein